MSTDDPTPDAGVKLCRSGEHQLTGDNLTADGRACRACRRKSQRDWARRYRNGDVAPVTPPADPAFDALESVADALVRAVDRRDTAAVAETLRAANAEQLAVVLAARLNPRGRGGTGACGSDAGVRAHTDRGRPLCAACAAWVTHRRPATTALVADVRARARADLIEGIVTARRDARLRRTA